MTFDSHDSWHDAQGASCLHGASGTHQVLQWSRALPVACALFHHSDARCLMESGAGEFEVGGMSHDSLPHEFHLKMGMPHQCILLLLSLLVITAVARMARTLESNMYSYSYSY